MCPKEHHALVTSSPLDPALDEFPVVAVADRVEEDERRCRHCQSTALRVDWAQGDRVCTGCGVVDEGHLMDGRPGWQDDRSGLVPNDETQWIGGLEPTRLSSYVVGGGGFSQAMKQLRATQRKQEHWMMRQQARALRQVHLARRVQIEEVRPEYEAWVERQEQLALRRQEALHADKWSLERALNLFGPNASEDEDGLDAKLRRAARDLYDAHRMLQASTLRLSLPDRVTQESTTLLLQYARRKDKLSCRGVASTKDPEASSKQRAALVSGIVFLVSRNLGWPRSVDEVCGAVHRTPKESVLRKHCAKAIAEIKQTFPEQGRSFLQNKSLASTDRFVEHAIAKLRLPPVADASVRLLVARCRQELSGTRLTTLCAAMAFFVAQSGHTMQEMAKQANKKRRKESASADVKSSEVLEQASEDVAEEQRMYEMRRTWDAWNEQTSWERSLKDVETSCGVASKAILEKYRSTVFPRRDELLKVLKEATTDESSDDSSMLSGIPMASTLLPHLPLAGSLLKKP